MAQKLFRGFTPFIPYLASYKQCPTFSLRPLDKVKSTVFKNVTENKTTICSHLSRHFYIIVSLMRLNT